MVLGFLREFSTTRGYPPTVRELAGHLGLTSPRGAAKHLASLEEKGWIKRKPGLSRGIELSGGSAFPHTSVPILGTVPAGPLDLAVEDVEGELVLDPSIAGEDTFLLRVKGNSMIGDHIAPEDLALVRRQETAEDGDIVVAMVGDEATLKRFKKARRNSPPRLEPSNPEFNPIVLKPGGSEARIIGKVQGIIRLMNGSRRTK